MKSIIGYVVVIVALGVLTLIDYETSEAKERAGSAYYSNAVTGASFGSTSLSLKGKSQKRLVAAANNKLAVWPERILKVKHRNFLLAQAFAIRAEDYKKEMGKFLTKQDEFVVFAADDDERFDGFFVTLNKLPVVINETGGQLGIVTGNVVVKVKSPEVAGLVASSAKSEIVSVNDLKNTATLKLPLDQDLTEVIHAIRNHAGVESADFQIVAKGI